MGMLTSTQITSRCFTRQSQELQLLERWRNALLPEETQIPSTVTMVIPLIQTKVQPLPQCTILNMLPGVQSIRRAMVKRKMQLRWQKVWRRRRLLIPTQTFSSLYLTGGTPLPKDWRVRLHSGCLVDAPDHCCRLHENFETHVTQRCQR